MDEAWNDLSQTMRNTFETSNNCCGFKSPQDRTGCSEERITNAVACSTKLSGRQNSLLLWLVGAVFIFAILSFVNYLVSYQLIRAYNRAKKEFNNRQAERIAAKNSRRIDEETAADPGALKTVKLEMNKSSMSYLPDFLKPTPKPTICKSGSEAHRSSGTSLTYEEIAAKYRK